MAVPTRETYDALFTVYVVLGAAIGCLVFFWMLLLLVRYRAGGPNDAPRRQPPTDGPAPGRTSVGDRREDLRTAPRDRSVKSAVLATVAMLVVLFGLTLGTMETVDRIDHPPTDDAIHVKVVGFQFGWRFVYEDANGSEAFASYGELVVPTGEVIILGVTSDDVMHTFAVPDFRIKTDAIPEQVNVIWFMSDEPGEHAVLCMELCGIAHAHMNGTVRVVERRAYDSWWQNQDGGW